MIYEGKYLPEDSSDAASPVGIVGESDEMTKTMGCTLRGEDDLKDE